jgi:hypothetical protein
MNRIFAITITAFASLCIIAPGVLMLLAIGFSKVPTNQTPNIQLARDWTRSPPADRAHCLRLTGSTGAYTDLLRCLETKHEARQHAKEPDGLATVGGSMP